MDIEHLDLSKGGVHAGVVGLWVGLCSEVALIFAGKVPALQHCKLPLVGVGKHLCGAATGESSDQ